ncbi:MAG: hypothetical protein OCD02_15025 [Spirochaetaceae bacterium]
MNKRENFLSMLRRQGYEYAPVDLVLCPSLLESYEKDISSTKNFEDYFGLPWREVEDGKIIAVDDSVYEEYYKDKLKEGRTIDSWGVGHEPGSDACMHMTYMRHPMKDLTTIEELENYPYPDYLNGDFSHQKTQIDAIHEKGLASCGNMQITIWEASWYLRSMEQLMMDMIMDKEKAELIIDKVLELSIHRAVQYAKAGCDILFFGDDIGMQSSIMMSVEMYVEWFKPRLTKLIDTVKKVNPNIIIFYHSCGFVEPFIPHLIEAGVDVLNPVQPECMDFEKLHGLYGDKISFHGTIGTQTTMPFGTPDEVRELVIKNLSIAGKKGGLFCSPTHMLEPEVPWENIMAYIEACKSFKP